MNTTLTNIHKHLNVIGVLLGENRVLKLSVVKIVRENIIIITSLIQSFRMAW